MLFSSVTKVFSVWTAAAIFQVSHSSTRVSLNIGDPKQNSESSKEHILWVILVDRTINPNGGAQLLSRFVITNLSQHCHKRGSTQVCSPRGYYLTHPPSGDAVLDGRVQAETLEHLFSTCNTFIISVRKSEHKAHSQRLLWVGLTPVLLQKQPTKLKKAWHYNSWQTALQLLIALIPLTHYSLWRGEVQYSNVMQQASMFNVWVISQWSTHADNSLSWFDVGLFGVCLVLTLPLHWSADKSWQILGGSTIIYWELI